MIGRSRQFRVGPLVLGVLIGGAALRHFAGCERPVRRHWHHDHFARAWRQHHTGRHPWTWYPQEDVATEKSEAPA